MASSADPSGAIPDYLSSAAAMSPSRLPNFTPTIAEDTLTYTIHLPPVHRDQDAETAARTYMTLINSHVDELLNEWARSSSAGGGTEEGSIRWLWHKDGWELELVPESDIQDRRYRGGVQVDSSDGREEAGSDSEDETGGGRVPTRPTSEEKPGRKLEGHMRIGDAIDDEWLVVYLLKSISTLRPELVISLRDTDGEFLLIESANHLPRWVSPDNIENRFWLAAGSLHLIPLDQVSVDKRAYSRIARQKAVDQDKDIDMDAGEAQEDAAWLSEADGVRLIRNSSSSTPRAHGRFWAGSVVENAVWERIAGYPQAMKTHHQRCLAYLPEGIARALRADPGLVQRAVEGFYTRDPIQIRNASRSTHFLPKAESTVLSQVVMTRTSYAQLSGQTFHPPRTFGPEWRVPPAIQSVSEKERELVSREKRRRDLGIKITVGFEIMYKEDGRRSRAKGKGKQDSEVDEDGHGYKRYLDGLRKAGFFGEEMEGSQLWKEKMKKAREGWSSMRSADTTTRTSFADAVDEAILVSGNAAISELAAAADFEEDGEDWLTVSSDQLDGMLARAGGPLRDVPQPEILVPGADDQPDEAQAKELSDLAAKVNQFVEGQGDLQGAQFQDELSDDDILGGDSDDESDPGGGMDVDLTEEEKTARMAGLVPALKPEEWGAKTQPPASNGVSKKTVAFASEAAVEADEAESEALGVRPPVLERDNFDGVVNDSSDEDDAEPFGWPADSRQTAMQPRTKKSKKDIDPNTILLADALRNGRNMPTENLKPTTGEEIVELSDDEGEDGNRYDVQEEPEIDMEEEQEEFLKFARESLGINDDMWSSMLDDRRNRGAFVPKPIAPAIGGKPAKPPAAKAKINGSSKSRSDHEPQRSSNITDLPFGSVAPAMPFAPTLSGQTKTASLAPGERNTKLDSFEKVMQAMEDELARTKAEAKAKPPNAQDARGQAKKPASAKKPSIKGKSTGPAPGKGKATPLPANLPTEADLDDMTEDDLIAMERELKAALKSAGLSDDEDDSDLDGMFDGDEDEDELKRAIGGMGGDAKGDLKMMKDLLESFSAQGGGSGAAGNLFGRLAQGRDAGARS